jgi:alkylation response protein AidB-like acyl-CoA dehydrogenase
MVSDLANWAAGHANAPEFSLARRPSLRYEIADRAVEAEIARLMSYRVITMQTAGQIPNKESSVAKLYCSEMEQRIVSTALHTAGPYAQALELDWLQTGRMYLYSVALTIGGGTSEIQRNIIAMRGLGLPRA